MDAVAWTVTTGSVLSCLLASWGNVGTKCAIALVTLGIVIGWVLTKILEGRR